MKVNVKRLSNTAILPTHGSQYSAGYDLYADIKEPIMIAPHTCEKISTGLSIQIPEGFFGGIFARSGTATKKNLRPANCVGVCDSDYTGPYIVALTNDSDIPQTIEPQERIAQLVVLPFLSIDFNEVDELEETERGAGGFGSTGVK